MDESSRIDASAYIAQRGQPNTSSAPELIHALFETLPRYCQALFGLRETDQPVYLFNEHYVAKPAHSNVEFQRHQDGEKQLAMLRDLPPPYISAWCPLDPITPHNGPLTLESWSKPEHIETPCLRPGSVVFFSSNLWHSSSINSSDNIRRVYYAQYSSTPIQIHHLPLCNAVPCFRDGRG